MVSVAKLGACVLAFRVLEQLINWRCSFSLNVLVLKDGVQAQILGGGSHYVVVFRNESLFTCKLHIAAV